MDESLAYTLAEVFVETWDVLEASYRHHAPERSPVSYPFNPYATWPGVQVPLHQGAERYYRQHGYMVD